MKKLIVLATLFALLSVWLFVRGLTQRRYADAVSAALMYSMAVLSKEHSILLPGAAVLAVFLIGERRFAFRYAAVYLAACVPAARLLGRCSFRSAGSAARSLQFPNRRRSEEMTWMRPSLRLPRTV